jgi:uncharacterized iron-regulated protein
MRRLFVFCLACLSATAGAAGETNWGTWAKEARKQHPLAGSVYSPKHGGLATLPSGMTAALLLLTGKQGGMVLVGEVHDNPIHHKLQAWLIELNAKTWRDRRPGIVFEQIRVDQQPALDQFKALAEAGSGTAYDLFRLLEWDKSGWPSAQIYEPLFEAVLASKLPIYAGDPPQGWVRSVARGGLSSVPPRERSRLRLDDPIPAPLIDALRKELAGSHCGVLAAEAIEGMIAAQRYRDAHLADALLSAEGRYHDAPREEGTFLRGLIPPPQTAILIAGNGHIRTDRGVPWYLRLRRPTMNVTTHMLIEVEEGKTDPESYVPRDPEGKPAADLLIFTPRAEREDPCEAMRKSKR